MSVCCARYCSNTPQTGNSKTFFLFPLSLPEICKKWVMNMSGGKWQPYRNAVLCSDHFEEDQFDFSGPTVKLKPSAIPTLFNSPKQDSSCTDVSSSPSSLQSTLQSLLSDDQSQRSNLKITSVTSLAHLTPSGPQISLLNNQSLSSAGLKLPIKIDLLLDTPTTSSTVNTLQPTAEKSSPMVKRRKIFITSIEKLPEKPESTPEKDNSLEPILTEPIKLVATPTIATPALIRPALSLFKLAPTLIGPPIPSNLATTQMRPTLLLFKRAPNLIGSTNPIKRAPTPIKPAPIPIKPAPIPIQPATTLIKPATTPLKPATTPLKPATTPIKPATTPIKPATTPITDPKPTLQEIVLEDHHYYTKPNSEVSKQMPPRANFDKKPNKKLKPLKQKVRQLETKIRSMNKIIDSLKKEQVNSKEMFTKQASTVLTNLQRLAATSSKVSSCTAVFIRSLH